MKQLRMLMAATVGILALGAGLPGCNREPIARTDAELRTDEKITEQVKAAFGNSPSFKFPDVQVASFKGKVQLSGFVASDDQKMSAGSMAKGIPGVVDVENKISLKR